MNPDIVTADEYECTIRQQAQTQSTQDADVIDMASPTE